MKVICLREPKGSTAKEKPIVKVGEYYNVIDTLDDYWYELAEQPGCLYSQKLFIPVSDIDETEMIREYNTEKV